MAKIKFSTGQVVNFDGEPTMADIEEVATQLGIGTKTIEPTKQPVERFGVYKGVAKGVGSTIASLGTMTSKLLGNIPGKTGEFFKGGAEYGQELQDTTLKAQTTQEKIGKGIEQVAEFFIPVSKVAKGQKALDVLLDGSKLPSFLKSTGKVLGKAGLEGLGAGGVSLAQTGDVKQAGTTALTAGVIKGTTGTLGEVSKKLKIPEKLYSRIFKSSVDDAVGSIQSELDSGIQKTNPTKYAEYVKAGLIDKTGKVNETIAREAIDRGLKGSVKNMTKQTIQNTYDLELAARKTATGKPVNLKDIKGLSKTLLDTATDWDGVAGNTISDKALDFAQKVEKGTLDGGEVLKLKRFLDGLRLKSSFNPSAKRSLGQENYKYLSDTVRGKLNKLPGMSKIMDDYRFNIEALDSLGKELAKQGNKEAITAIDTLLLGTGLATGMTPTAVGLTGVRKALTNSTVRTNLAQAIEKSGVSSKLGIGTKGAISSGISKLISQ